MKPDNKAGGPWLYALGLVPVIWFALLIAPAISGGLSEIVNALPAAMNHPFKIVWCEDSVKTVLIFIAAYGLGIGIYLSSRRNYRRGEEHGSAKWGDPRAVNKKYRDKDPFKNRIFTQHVRMGLDGRKHRRNLNTLVVGGSGAGKSRFYAKVNICQCNTSLFILDCKGELLRDCGGLLERMGYEIKVVDLLNMEKSHCYNSLHIERRRAAAGGFGQGHCKVSANHLCRRADREPRRAQPQLCHGNFEGVESPGKNHRCGHP